MYSPFRSDFYVSQAYKGAGKYSAHRGIDLVAFGPDKGIYVPPGTPACTVDHVGWENPANHAQGYGFYVRLRYRDGNQDIYIIFGHLVPDSCPVKLGQAVQVGDCLGQMGNTGRSDFPHTHLEIRTGVPGVFAGNLNPAAFYGLPNAWENMKRYRSDWPAPPAEREVTGTGTATGKDSGLAGKYIVKAGSWNLRNGPGLSEKVLTVLHGGDSAQCWGYFTDTPGIRWLYVVSVKDGVKFTGFISSTALTRRAD